MSVSTEVSKYLGAARKIADIWGNLIVNPKDTAYGAKGDGVTDDSVAFAAAISAIASNGGGILRIPPGKYILNSPLTVNSIDIVIEGSGVQLTQLFFPTSHGIIYTTTNLFSDTCQIRDLSVITLADNLYRGIQIEFPSNVGSPWRNAVIENVTVSGSTSVASYNDGTNNNQTGIQNWTTGIRLVNCAVSVVRDCIVRAGDGGTSVTNGNGIGTEGYTVDLLIQGCKFYSCDVGIRKSGTGEGLIIDNCMMINVDYGVYINQTSVSQDGVYASIQNCHINYRSAGAIARYHPQITVQNCLIYKQGTDAGVDIQLEYCDRSKILSNTCIVNLNGGTVNGVVIANSSKCLISDNIIEERDTGIILQASSSACKVVGNKLSLNTTNVTDSGTGNYVEKARYEGSTVVSLSGGATTLDIAIPSGMFGAKPTNGFLTTANGTQYILGFYDYDTASSTATNARFTIKRIDEAAITAESIRFNFQLTE